MLQALALPIWGWGEVEVFHDVTTEAHNFPVYQFFRGDASGDIVAYSVD